MKNTAHRRFYFLAVAVLLLLSAYPLMNGARMVFLWLKNGMLQPEQYAKYVIPYAALCLAAVLFAVCSPLFLRWRRGLAVGLGFAWTLFFVVEAFMEQMQINTAVMTMIDPATLAPDAVTVAPDTADIWQAALCIASPAVRDQTIAFAMPDRLYYVMPNGAYKIHYYLICLLLLTMVCALMHQIGRVLRDGGEKTPLALRGGATAALLALCVFANTTAFFRDTAPIQTPLASVLTCLFFVALGVSVGVYLGSGFLRKGRGLGLALPAAAALAATVAMYVGEAVMMGGNLYRFGIGWFFEGLPGLSLAPVDLAVLLAACALTWLVLALVRGWRPRASRGAALTLLLCVAALSSCRPAPMAEPPAVPHDGVYSDYAYDACLYMNPLSSFSAFHMPYVYRVSEDAFTIVNTESGEVVRFPADYERTPVDADIFDASDQPFFHPPDLSAYRERNLIAVLEGGQRLYEMDGELWLVRGTERVSLWSIYCIKPVETPLPAAFDRALAVAEADEGGQMTLRDAYALARKGDALTLDDLAPFSYRLIGPDYEVRRYEVEYANTLFVDERQPDFLRFVSGRTFDLDKCVNLRDGFEAVAAYLDPLRSLSDIQIEAPDFVAQVQTVEPGGPAPVLPERELIYEYDYDACYYYLTPIRSGTITVILEDGERLPLKTALAERRATVEDLVGHGLGGITMEPIENPLGGMFVSLHHQFRFSLNGEAFYPSKSFLYIAAQERGGEAYFKLSELAEFLEWYGHDPAPVQAFDGVRTEIAGREYIAESELTQIGLSCEIGWYVSSHTPVHLTIG